MYTINDLVLQQALATINVNPADLAGSQARLINFVNQLSVEARGATANATTVLFSGKVGDISSSDISDSMKSNPNIRNLDKTLASEVVASNAFKAKVAEMYGYANLQSFNDAPSTADAKQWLFHGSSGPWAEISGRFVLVPTRRVGMQPGRAASRIWRAGVAAKVAPILAAARRKLHSHTARGNEGKPFLAMLCHQSADR